MLAYNSSFFHHVLFRWILSRLNHPLIFRFLCTSRQPSSYQHFRKTLPPSTIFILLCCFFHIELIIYSKNQRQFKQSKDSRRLYAIDVHGIDQCAPTARLEWATNMAAKQAIRRHFEVCSATVKSMPGYSGDIFLFIMKSMYFTVKARVRGYKVM